MVEVNIVDYCHYLVIAFVQSLGVAFAPPYSLAVAASASLTALFKAAVSVTAASQAPPLPSSHLYQTRFERNL